MLGFDSLYRNDCPDEELAHISATEQRILLSRDRGLLRRSIVTRGYLVRAAQPREQLIEVCCRFNLNGSIAPFCRLYRVQHLAASRSQGTNQRSPAARDQKTLRRISLLPTVQPSLLEGVALPTHGRSNPEYH
jgi:Mut7-C RNAse domain